MHRRLKTALKKLLELIEEFSKVAITKSIYKNVLGFGTLTNYQKDFKGEKDPILIA